MIRYSLICDTGHRFETWFRDSDAFDDQAARHQVECPTCQSPSVAKTIMAPAVLSGRQAPGQTATEVAPPSPTPRPLRDEYHVAARALVKAMHDKILSEGDDVGVDFPRDARRMHDGEIEMRPIHGQASRDEVIELLEDGILVLPLPSLPEELN